MKLDWLKHAFAIESAAAFEPTEAQGALVEKLCRQIVARELTTPALLFLETVRPLNFVTAQTLHFFAPFLSAVGNPKACEELAALLEHRGALDYVCRRIEALEGERARPNVTPDQSTPGPPAS